MNFHGIAAPYVAAVNPLIPVSVQTSTGPGEIADDGTRDPSFATPGAFTASIATNVLTVSAVSQGKLESRQTLAGAGVLPSTEIVSQLTGDPAGGPGTYLLSRTYDAPVASVAMTSTLILMAQIQPVSWRDLQQIEGLNLGGTRRKIYLYGSVEAIERVRAQGGDLVTVADGVNRGVWLVAQVLEQFPDWVSAFITLQNE